MKLMSLMLVLGMITSLSACKSDSEKHAQSSEASAIPCTCGTPEAQMEGCANPVCMSGKTNPDNPNCACGTLTIGPASKK